MSEGKRTATRRHVEIGDTHVSAQSGGDVKVNLQSQVLKQKLSPREVDRRINGIVAPLATPLEMLIQSVKDLSERSSNRSTERIVPSERSRPSG